MLYAHASALPARTFPQATGALEPGTRLEEFEIERVLCDSGYGVVYLARDLALDLTVVLKEYLPATLATHGAGLQVELHDPSHADAFERGRLAFIDEARILARCDHPSLLRVHRIWEANGTAYRVMPYYPGQTLLAVRRGMREAPDEASLRALLDALLGALGTLHSAGHVHGDVSPDNILLLPDDRPVLMDFGAVARAILSERTRHLMEEFDPSGAARLASATGVAVPAGSDLRALEAVVQFCIHGDSPASASSPKVTALREPWAGAPRKAQEPVGSARYSHAFLNAMAGLRDLEPGDPAGTAAHVRSLLRSHGAQDSGRAEPVLTPEPAAMATSGAAEPEFMRIDPMDDLSYAMAAIAKEARARASVPPEMPARSASLALAKPRLPRGLALGGAALMMLAFGAAGWQLSDRLAADKAPVTLTAVAKQSLAPTPADPGSPGAPQATVSDALPQLASPQQDGVGPVVGAPASRVPVAEPVAAKTAQPAAPSLFAAARAPGSPREECGARTEFALYRCMQTQCARAPWAAHAQCVRLRLRDEVE